MKVTVQDVFSELSEQENLIAIYGELIAHLQKFEHDDEMEIPIDGSTETVSTEYIEQVRAGLESDYEKLKERKQSILHWRVEIPEEKDDGETGG